MRDRRPRARHRPDPRRELLPRYPSVDDVVGLTHAYGCGVAIDAPDAHIPIRTLRNLARNPNLGGQALVIGLGCEKLQPEQLIAQDDKDLEKGERWLYKLQESTHGFAEYDRYLQRGRSDRSANTTPGNKAGGLSNIVEKSLGSIAKSGTSPLRGVVGPGERVRGPGLQFCATPASDFVCGTLQLAAGMNLHVFTTGRGTPYGLAIAPVVKVSTRTELAERWPDLIDVDAGRIASGTAIVEDLGWELFHYYLDVASGRKKTWAERHRLHNDLTLFNPAPIT